MLGFSEAMLGFLRRQIGLRTDAASASGSVHAKIGDLKSTLPGLVGQVGIVASDTVQLESLSAVSVTGTTFEKKKEFYIPLPGHVRVTAELYRGSGEAYADLYFNGVNTGFRLTGTTSSYAEYTLDIPVSAGGILAIWLACSTASTAYMRNVRIKYTIGTITGSVIL